MESKIIHGKATKVIENFYEQVERNGIGGGDVYLISDPPYNQGYHYDEYHDSLELDSYIALLEIFRLFPSVVIHYPEETIDILPRAIGRRVEEVVSWVYPSNTAKQHRLITWWGCEPDMNKVGQDYRNPEDPRIQKRIENGEKARLYDWWEINQVKNVSKEHDHPCPIPMEVAEKVILTTTEEGDVVVDPFCGIGTIPMAAKQHNRDYIGVDMSEKYVKTARQRINNMTDNLFNHD